MSISKVVIQFWLILVRKPSALSIFPEPVLQAEKATITSIFSQD
jgi:hypothetical protein